MYKVETTTTSIPHRYFICWWRNNGIIIYKECTYAGKQYRADELTFLFD